MNKITDIFLKISKVIIYAMFSVQVIYAVWWVIHNIATIPDFSIPSESFLYSQVAAIFGNGFFLLYLLQGIALYLGIRAMCSNNRIAAAFIITNPLILQFVFSLTPDIFALSVVLGLLGDLLKKENIKSKHAILLVLLGILHSRYFLIGIIILLAMYFTQKITMKKEKQNLTRKEKLSNLLAVTQVILVVVLILISYRTQNNMRDDTLIKQEFVNRFTVDESKPSQHSVESVAKGFVEDSAAYVIAPFYSIRIIDDLRLTQNSWNYINFTREVPNWSRAYMELTERNLLIVVFVFVLSVILSIVSGRFKGEMHFYNWSFLLTCLIIAVLISATSKRGLDYRNGLVFIPVWYGVIIGFYENINIFSEKEDQIES